jgi:hypothetical protein
MIIKTSNTQTILDICLISTGTVESLFDLLKLNNLPDLSIQNVQQLQTIQPIKSRIVNYYLSNGIAPATNIKADQLNENGITLLFTNDKEVTNTNNITLTIS